MNDRTESRILSALKTIKTFHTLMISNSTDNFVNGHVNTKNFTSFGVHMYYAVLIAPVLSLNDRTWTTAVTIVYT